MKLLNYFPDSIFRSFGFDFGSYSTKTYVRDSGSFTAIPSIVQIDKQSNEIIKIGNDAEELIGKTTNNFQLINPFENGVISDYSSTRSMINKIIRENGVNKIDLRILKMIVGVPLVISEVEIEAIIDAFKDNGVRMIHIIENPLAIYYNHFSLRNDNLPHLIIHLGHNILETTVVFKGEIISKSYSGLGSKIIDNKIKDFLLRKYNLRVSSFICRDLKHSLGNSLPQFAKETKSIIGQDSVTFLPKKLEISGIEIYECISDYLSQVIDQIKRLIDIQSDEIILDLFNSEVVLSGGGVNLRNIGKLLKTSLKFNSKLIVEPEMDIIHGLGKILKDKEILKQFEFKDYILK